MESRERGFFGKLLVFILSILAVIGLIAMSLSVVSSFINPLHFHWIALFGLAFWVIFFYNALVLLSLILLWSRKVWISIVALLIAIPGVNKSYSFGSQSDAFDSIRIMSYNVHMLKPIDEKTNSEEFANQLMDMVREQNPDILCMQEFQGFKRGVTRQKCIDIFAEGAGYQYVYYNKKNNYSGNVVFSKYPIVKVDETSGFGQENSYGVMVSVDAGDKGKFYVANVHLLSYNITDSEIEVLTNSNERQDKLDTIGKTVLHKLGFAFQKRSKEQKRMLEGMPPIDGPIIVCGDFNEPPLSYNYRQMQKAGFVDTFTKVGRGIKPTYAGKLPLLRIDYIWANDNVKPLSFKRYRYRGSDHYPIILDFTMK